jgi:hypothetical protein
MSPASRASRDTLQTRELATVFIAIPILVLWYAAHAVLSRFVGTCTMGDTRRFVTGMIFGVPAGAIAVALLLLAPARGGWRAGVVLATGPFALLAIYLWAPLAISAGLHGHVGAKCSESLGDIERREVLWLGCNGVA